MLVWMDLEMTGLEPSRDVIVEIATIVTDDRRFLAAYLPDIENWLHYRSVDVSSVKELVKRWYPAVDVGRPSKQGNHRALDDIRASIEELRFYRSSVFLPAATDPASESPSVDR